jgi:ferredoxin--NADP+ reductase
MGWVTGRVCELRQWNERLFSLSVEASIEPFKAGQYNRLRLTVGGEEVSRPYSYVNSPTEQLLEFHFVRLEHGCLSIRLAQLVPGDAVDLMPRSTGLFTLDTVPDAQALWLLATGTGLGPYLSILATQEPWERFSEIRLIHCVRQVSDLSYRDRIEALSGPYKGRFKYVPLVTRESMEGALTQRIPLALESGSLEERAGLELHPEHSQVMLCGNPEMVRETQAVLRARGFKRNRRGDPGQITVENYW